MNVLVLEKMMPEDPVCLRKAHTRLHFIVMVDWFSRNPCSSVSKQPTRFYPTNFHPQRSSSILTCSPSTSLALFIYLSGFINPAGPSHTLVATDLQHICIAASW